MARSVKHSSHAGPFSRLSTLYKRIARSNAKTYVVFPNLEDGYSCTVLNRHKKGGIDTAQVEFVPLHAGGDGQKLLNGSVVNSVDENIVLIVPRDQTVVRYVRLPVRDPEQVARMAPHEAAAAAPWSLDESLTGYECQASSEENHSWIALYAIRSSVVERHIETLSKLGFAPTHVLTSTACLASFLVTKCALSNCVVISNGPVGLEIVRISDGRHTYSRSIPDDERLNEAIGQILARDHVGTELAPSSGGAYSIGIVGEHVLELQDLTGHPLKDIADSSVVQTNQPSSKEKQAELAYAVGAFVLAESSPNANLAPLARKTSVEIWRTARRMAILLLMTAWCCTAIAGAAYGFYGSQLHRVNLAEAEIARLGPGARALQEKDRVLRAMRNEREEISRPLRLVLELYERTPTQVSLNSMRYDKKGILVLGGEAPSYSTVVAYMESLSASSLLREVDLAGAQRQPGQGAIVEFRIECRLRNATTQGTGLNP
jgi:hypothetical protein